MSGSEAMSNVGKMDGSKPLPETNHGLAICVRRPGPTRRVQLVLANGKHFYSNRSHHDDDDDVEAKESGR
jgi:hypothetical protein